MQMDTNIQQQQFVTISYETVRQFAASFAKIPIYQNSWAFGP